MGYNSLSGKVSKRRASLALCWTPNMQPEGAKQQDHRLGDETAAALQPPWNQSATLSLLARLAQACVQAATNPNLPSHISFGSFFSLYSSKNCSPFGIGTDFPVCFLDCFLPKHHNMSTSPSRNNLLWELVPGVCTSPNIALCLLPIFNQVASSALCPPSLHAAGSGALPRTKPAAGVRCYKTTGTNLTLLLPSPSFIKHRQVSCSECQWSCQHCSHHLPLLTLANQHLLRLVKNKLE